MPIQKRKVSETNGIQGFTFGIVEGTILLMGLMLGLSVTQNREITVIALLVTALADAFANSAGFHVSQETEVHHERKEVWASTIYCFAATFLVMGALVVPVLVFESYSTAIIVSSALAVIIIACVGAFVAKQRNESALHTIIEYLAIVLIVSIICFFLGEFAGILIK